MPERSTREKYLQHSATRLPFVTVKFAQSLDGRIATSTGDSQWISSPPAQRFVHKLRSEHDAILVGIGTVLADDPRLTVRLTKGRDPMRIVVDSRLRTPLSARVLADGAASHTLVVANENADLARVRAIEALGSEVLRLPASQKHIGVDLQRLLEELGGRRVESVLVEGGKQIITSLLAARLVDRVIIIIAPKIIGQGIDAIGDLGIARLDEAITFSSARTHKLGQDMIFDGRFK
jgi:riboflavin-specific deaminase-like protein